MSGLILPGQGAANVPDMPPGARATATACDEWMLQLIGHLASQVTALAQQVGANLGRVDRNAVSQAEALNDLIARLGDLEAKVNEIDLAITEVGDE